MTDLNNTSAVPTETTQAPASAPVAVARPVEAPKTEAKGFPLAELQRLSNANPSAAHATHALANRKRFASTTNVDSFIVKLITENVQQVLASEVYAYFKGLSDLGIGKLLMGRPSKSPTEFQWHYNCVDVANAALGSKEIPALLSDSEKAVKEVEKEEAPAKQKRGRPTGSKNKAVKASSKPKAKASTSSKWSAARKRKWMESRWPSSGRKAASTAKRGRPTGSKNKARNGGKDTAAVLRQLKALLRGI